MCVQCMVGAMGASAGASGVRAWLATRRWAWLTPAALKRITVGLLVLVLFASSVLIGGSTSAAPTGSQTQAPAQAAPGPARPIDRSAG